MWYEKDENNKLFQRTLAKIKPQLQKSEYKGYIDINCIVNHDTVYPLEITSRFGSSTVETQGEIQISPWSDLLVALAEGDDYCLEYKNGYSINVALTVPPFPYRTFDQKILQNIFFRRGNLFFRQFVLAKSSRYRPFGFLCGGGRDFYTGFCFGLQSLDFILLFRYY